MDQGIVASGLAPSTSAKAGEVAQAAIARARKSSARTVSQEEKLRTGAAEAVGAQQTVPTAEDKRIQTLQSISSKANLAFNGEFFGGMAGGALAWVASKFNATRLRIGIKAIISAPFKAMRETSLNNLSAFPHHYWNAVNGYAKEASQLTATRYAVKNKLMEKGGELSKDMLEDLGKGNKVPGMAAAERWAVGAAKRAENWKSSVKEVVHAAPVAAAEMKPVTGFVGQFAEKRAGAYMVRHGKALDRAVQALTEKPPGVWQRVVQFFTGRAPEQIGVHEKFAEIGGKLQAAKGLKGEALTAHMTDISKSLQELVGAGSKSELAGRAAHVMKFTTKAGVAAGTAHTYTEAAQKGFAGLAKLMAKAGGKMSVFAALIGIGAVTGISATLLSAKKENREAEEAYKALVADIGDGKNFYAEEVRKALKADKHSRGLTTGLSVVGEAAMSRMIASPTAGGMGVMGASMLPVALPMLASDNPLLSAYEALRREDAGQLKMEPAQRLQAIKTMIAIVPNVAAHGGMYNRLVTPIAADMLERKMTAKQVVQLLGNEAEFTKLAADVNAKREAAKKAEQPVAHAKAELKPAAAEATVHGKAEAANAPSLKVGGIQHQGRVEQAERLRA